MTDDEQIRLDCLRLAQTFGGSPGSTVERARVYENYIAGRAEKAASGYVSAAASRERSEP